ncbi:uncharacterized protein LOC110344845 [Heterocephalus glaber]|uniref:Uncharacterized protein LOC110344845 n=1 Tax=Heterocephalus glaber TaxID=10181 RepID=A0AAX6RH99_HETGA|nr:uncharacterized protein LOC110344845 [Heterocephalus glaber]
MFCRNTLATPCAPQAQSNGHRPGHHGVDTWAPVTGTSGLCRGSSIGSPPWQVSALRKPECESLPHPPVSASPTERRPCARGERPQAGLGAGAQRERGFYGLAGTQPVVSTETHTTSRRDMAIMGGPGSPIRRVSLAQSETLYRRETLLLQTPALGTTEVRAPVPGRAGTGGWSGLQMLLAAQQEEVNPPGPRTGKAFSEAGTGHSSKAPQAQVLPSCAAQPGLSKLFTWDPRLISGQQAGPSVFLAAEKPSERSRITKSHFKTPAKDTKQRQPEVSGAHSHTRPRSLPGKKNKSRGRLLPAGFEIVVVADLSWGLSLQF